MPNINKSLKVTALIALALLLIPGAAMPCSFDTDCEIGSKCIKDNWQLYGYCANGMYPGNDYDRQPVRDPLDITGKRANTCSFDTDCGIGNICYKNPKHSLQGVCVEKPSRYSGYDGPGGAAYDGPGGPAYDGPGGPCYDGPGGPAYGGPGGPCYSGPGGTGENCPTICR